MKIKLITSTIFIVLLANMLTITFNAVPIVLAQEDVPYEVLDDIGTYFELQNFNVSITTNTTVHVMLRVSSEMIDYLIENASKATSTQLTLGNLQPSTTYYMYEDSYMNEKVFTTDDVGSYTYTQDLSQLHHVFIQPRSGTIFISESTTLQSDIYDSVEIIADNVVLDLNGYNIIGEDTWGIGVIVWFRKNVTIKNGGINNFIAGIYVGSSRDIVISGNTIASNMFTGLELSKSDFNMITDNIFTLNYFGLDIIASSSNIIYHNNFIDNRQNAQIWDEFIPLINIWDNGYPSGGNYWSDYTGVDQKSGPNQDQPGNDGIGDTSYVIDRYNRDRYPLMSPWTPDSSIVSVTAKGYPVLLISSSTISDIRITPNKLRFTVTGEKGTSGYVRAMLPVDLIKTKIRVYLNNTELIPPPYPVIVTNNTHYFIYFAFIFTSIYDVAILFAPITANVTINPDALNLKSSGEFVTAYIELPEGYSLSDSDVSTILLNDTIPVDSDAPTAIGDYDSDGIADLMVKFSRAEVISYILANVNMTKLAEERFMTIILTITGELTDGTPFQGSDTIKIILNIGGAGAHTQLR